MMVYTIFCNELHLGRKITIFFEYTSKRWKSFAIGDKNNGICVVGNLLFLTRRHRSGDTDRPRRTLAGRWPWRCGGRVVLCRGSRHGHDGRDFFEP